MARRVDIPRSARAVACLVVENMAALVGVGVLRVEEWRVVRRAAVVAVEVVSITSEFRGRAWRWRESACHDWLSASRCQSRPQEIDQQHHHHPPSGRQQTSEPSAVNLLWQY